MDSSPERRSGRKGPDALEARYANYFEIGHNAYEFILEFGQYQPQSEQVQIQTRIVTGPVFAKLLFGLLGQALEQFENEIGPIEGGDLDRRPERAKAGGRPRERSREKSPVKE
jgi:hypothetical protein